MIHPGKFFTETEKAGIAEAVRKAELETSGEIVPYVVGHSDRYPEAGHRAGAALAFLVLIGFALTNLFTDYWLPFGIAESAVAAILAYGIGNLVGLFTSVKRHIVSNSAKQSRVDERAALAFLTEEVFKTRDRTGVLIFISLLERRVRILGDSGINAKVSQEQWDAIVAGLIQQIKSGTPAEGLIEAIEKCGALLKEYGLAIKSDDTNELDNNVRLSDQ
jgi:putative membrane protein